MEFFFDSVSGTYSKHSLDTKKAAAIAHLRNTNSIWIKSPSTAAGQD